MGAKTRVHWQVRRRYAGWLFLLAVLLTVVAWWWRDQRQPLLLVPAIGGLGDCLELAAPSAPLEPACQGPHGSAAMRINAMLDALGPRQSPNGQLVLGYTLVIPLLNLFEAQGSDWVVDTKALQRIANTLQDVDRPVVLYLFSTHFSENAPIEPVLAQDPANLAFTPKGPLPVDRYLGAALYPWSIARLDNTITRRREQAMAAVTATICALPSSVRERVAGVNLLGEVHHLYPDFETGVGFGSPYVITDYSDVSRRDFQAFLRQRFRDVKSLNSHLGSSFSSFEQIDPPAKDIRRERLDNFWQHLDAQAAGSLAVGGWVHDTTRRSDETPWVRIYLDGELIGRVPAHFARQDVAQARPELGTDRVGWRYDLRFTELAQGRHRIDIALERADARLVALGTRYVAVMDRAQSTPQNVPLGHPLPAVDKPDAAVTGWIDTPTDDLPLFYNPLVPLWHEFRGQQVVTYLAHFDALLDNTCLAKVPHRTQQIAPAEGAGWDASRFAAGASLVPFGHVGLGINLYGEAAEGGAIFDWLARAHWSSYSVTEFHPLRALSADELAAVLAHHRQHGARSLSFFLHPHQPSLGQAGAPPNPLALDPNNPQNGSDKLYHAMQDVLRR